MRLHLDVLDEYICAWCTWCKEISGCNEGPEHEEDGCEKAKDILGSGEGGMHLGLMVLFPGQRGGYWRYRCVML